MARRLIRNLLFDFESGSEYTLSLFEKNMAKVRSWQPAF